MKASKPTGAVSPSRRLFCDLAELGVKEAIFALGRPSGRFAEETLVNLYTEADKRGVRVKVEFVRREEYGDVGTQTSDAVVVGDGV